MKTIVAAALFTLALPADNYTPIPKDQTRLVPLQHVQRRCVQYCYPNCKGCPVMCEWRCD